jgi:hypothetical protein
MICSGTGWLGTIDELPEKCKEVPEMSKRQVTIILTGQEKVWVGEYRESAQEIRLKDEEEVDNVLTKAKASVDQQQNILGRLDNLVNTISELTATIEQLSTRVAVLEKGRQQQPGAFEDYTSVAYGAPF